MIVIACFTTASELTAELVFLWLLHANSRIACDRQYESQNNVRCYELLANTDLYLQFSAIPQYVVCIGLHLRVDCHATSDTTKILRYIGIYRPICQQELMRT